MIVDSVVWIALKYKRDKFHKQATDKFLSIIKANTTLFVTDYIIIETYSFLLRKTSFEVAQEALQMFFNSNIIKIFFNDASTFSNTQSICKKYAKLSYVDANIVLNMKKYGISEIFSYDSGFDSIKAIKRIF